MPPIIFYGSQNEIQTLEFIEGKNTVPPVYVASRGFGRPGTLIALETVRRTQAKNKAAIVEPESMEVIALKEVGDRR